jgi:hypothetical protein
MRKKNAKRATDLEPFIWTRQQPRVTPDETKHLEAAERQAQNGGPLTGRMKRKAEREAAK